jgi:hypothetical protein
MILLAIMTLPACVPLPIPHKVIRNSHLYGQVVDAETGQPIRGVSVDLNTPGSFYRTVEVSTDEHGRFDMVPTDRWGFLWILAFLPFEGPDSCEDTLRFVTSSAARELAPPKYRDLSFAVRSCPPEPVLFFNHNSNNRDIEDNVGVVQLKRLPPPQ